MNRSRTTTTTLTLLTALACLAAPATASAGQTIWRLGAADDLDATPTEASDEFTATGYDPIASYDITTQGSATTNIALQGYLDDDPTCDACAEQIEIEFEVPAGGYANHALNLVYARYGSETDLIRLDVATLTFTSADWNTPQPFREIFRERLFVEPDVFRRPCAIKEQEIRRDNGVRSEDAVG